jgi:hypothetical protein
MVVRRRGTHIFVDNRLTNGGEVVSLMLQLPFTPQEDSWYSFLFEAIVLLEGLGRIKKSNDLIGIRTCDFQACSIVPQPTTLPHAPPST